MGMFKLHNTSGGAVVENAGKFFSVDMTWDQALNTDNLPALLAKTVATGPAIAAPSGLLAPIGAGSVGSRRDLFPEPYCAHGGIKISRRRRLL